jgi:hypothetical protein
MKTHERHDGRSSWLPPDPRSQICTKPRRNGELRPESGRAEERGERDLYGGGARDLTAVVDRDEIAAKTPGDEVGEAERRGVYEWRECPDLWRRWGWEELAAI